MKFIFIVHTGIFFGWTYLGKYGNYIFMGNAISFDNISFWNKLYIYPIFNFLITTFTNYFKVNFIFSFQGYATPRPGIGNPAWCGQLIYDQLMASQPRWRRPFVPGALSLWPLPRSLPWINHVHWSDTSIVLCTSLPLTLDRPFGSFYQSFVNLPLTYWETLQNTITYSI